MAAPILTHPFSRVYICLPPTPKDPRFPELTDSVIAFDSLLALLDAQGIEYTHVSKRTNVTFRKQLAVADVDTDDFKSLVVGFPVRVSVTVNELFGKPKELPINVTLVYESEVSYKAHKSKLWSKLIYGCEELVLEN
jgi:hypothetical protein